MDTNARSPKEKQENPLVSLVLNIVIPSVILMKFSDDANFGPVKGLLLALAFPIAYGIYDFIDRKKFNFISALGFVSILLTGGISLMKLDAHWIAVKEATVPAIIGLVILGSLKTPYPLIRKMIYNEKIIDIARVDASLTARGNHEAFERLLVQASYLLAGSFFLSSLLNYALAKFLLLSPPGTAEFNAELGRMTALSYPVIVIPSMIVMMLALWRLLSGIKKLTGLDLETVFKGAQQQSRR